MIFPSRQWYLVAAALGLLALLRLAWPGAAVLLLIADLVWLTLLGVEAAGLARIDFGRFGVSREAPPAFSVGNPMPVSYQWRNPLWRLLLVRVREEFPGLLDAGGERMIRLPAAGALREEILVRPVRRGRAVGGSIHLRVAGGLGLAWRQGRVEVPWRTTVYPSLRESALRSLPTMAQRRREAGFRNVRRIGEGRVFESLKEWVPGEDIRTIDWKATARRGKLIVRQYEEERRQQVMIVIDAGRLLTAELDGRSRLDAAIDAALALAHAAVSHDDNVGLMVFADTVSRFIPPARGRRALRAVLDGLAGIEGRLVEPNYPAAFSYLASRNRKRALTVLFTDVIDRTASEALVAQAGALRPRHLPLAVALRDPSLERVAAARPSSVDAAYERAAVEELLEAREDALAELRGHGVMVLDVRPDGAARAVVAQYDRLKRRALL
jgi:uncharacterized protein (DUF58 family)